MKSNDNASTHKPTINRQAGKLYVVATPIGNLSDISVRAIDTLRRADVVFAEDTRQSAKLLRHYNITTSVRPLHQHNESKLVPQMVKKLQQGRNLALISDAGTPLISDPGYRLIRQVRQQGLVIVPVPGACALIAALSCCGLATDRFYFYGFLPARTQKRCEVLKQLMRYPDTLILYESCHRIVDTLQDMQSIFADQCQVVVARELTKKFETFYMGTPSELVQQLTQDSNNQKGEFVILIEDPSSDNEKWSAAVNLIAKLRPHIPTRLASQIAAETFGVTKNRLYQFAIGLNSKNTS